ncbi:adenosine A2a receptor a [Rhinoraja longicauda]
MQTKEEQVWDRVIYIVLEVVIAVLAVLGNVLVCWAVYLNSNLQNVTNFFVVSLAVADIAVGVLAIPFAITISTGFCSLFYGCLFIACFVLVLTQSSIFSLLAIAVDRYICIKIPLRYNSLVTGSRARGVICICWVLSFLIGLTPIFGWNKSNHNITVQMNGTLRCRDGMVPCLFEEVVTMEYMVYYNFFACVLVPLLLMLGIYQRIFMAARHQLKQMDFNSLQPERSRSTLQKEVQAAKSLAIIVGLFAACWLPLHIINSVSFFCKKCRPPASVLYFAIILSHANSVINPLIYAYRIREFRMTFRKILKTRVLRKTDQTFTRQNTRRSIHISGDNVNLQINGCGLDLLNTGGEEGGVADRDIVQHQQIPIRRTNGNSPGHPKNEQFLCQGQGLPQERGLCGCCHVHLHTAFPHKASCSALTDAS